MCYEISFVDFSRLQAFSMNVSLEATMGPLLVAEPYLSFILALKSEVVSRNTICLTPFYISN